MNQWRLDIYATGTLELVERRPGFYPTAELCRDAANNVSCESPELYGVCKLVQTEDEPA